jgi:Protein of unknown function (DUF1232)
MIPERGDHNPLTTGKGTAENRDARLPMAVGQREASLRRSAQTDELAQRKPKRRRHRYVEPLHVPTPPAKPLWPVIVCGFLIAVYIISQIDAIPDVPVIGIWDDIALAVFGIRKLDKRRAENEAAQSQFRRQVEEPILAEVVNERDRLPVPRLHGMTPPPQKPGFFARVMKAISILFGGDQ